MGVHSRGIMLVLCVVIMVEGVFSQIRGAFEGIYPWERITISPRRMYSSSDIFYPVGTEAWNMYNEVITISKRAENQLCFDPSWGDISKSEVIGLADFSLTYQEIPKDFAINYSAALYLRNPTESWLWKVIIAGPNQLDAQFVSETKIQVPQLCYQIFVVPYLDFSTRKIQEVIYCAYSDPTLTILVYFDNFKPGLDTSKFSLYTRSILEVPQDHRSLFPSTPHRINKFKQGQADFSTVGMIFFSESTHWTIAQGSKDLLIARRNYVGNEGSNAVSARGKYSELVVSLGGPWEKDGFALKKVFIHNAQEVTTKESTSGNYSPSRYFILIEVGNGAEWRLYIGLIDVANGVFTDACFVIDSNDPMTKDSVMTDFRVFEFKTKLYPGFPYEAVRIHVTFEKGPKPAPSTMMKFELKLIVGQTVSINPEVRNMFPSQVIYDPWIEVLGKGTTRVESIMPSILHSYKSIEKGKETFLLTEFINLAGMYGAESTFIYSDSYSFFSLSILGTVFAVSQRSEGQTICIDMYSPGSPPLTLSLIHLPFILNPTPKIFTVQMFNSSHYKPVEAIVKITSYNPDELVVIEDPTDSITGNEAVYVPRMKAGLYTVASADWMTMPRASTLAYVNSGYPSKVKIYGNERIAVNFVAREIYICAKFGMANDYTLTNVEVLERIPVPSLNILTNDQLTTIRVITYSVHESSHIAIIFECSSASGEHPVNYFMVIDSNGKQLVPNPLIKSLGEVRKGVIVFSNRGVYFVYDDGMLKSIYFSLYSREEIEIREVLDYKVLDFSAVDMAFSNEIPEIGKKYSRDILVIRTLSPSVSIFLNNGKVLDQLSSKNSFKTHEIHNPTQVCALHSSTLYATQTEILTRGYKGELYHMYTVNVQQTSLKEIIKMYCVSGKEAIVFAMMKDGQRGFFKIHNKKEVWNYRNINQLFIKSEMNPRLEFLYSSEDGTKSYFLGERGDTIVLPTTLNGNVFAKNTAKGKITIKFVGMYSQEGTFPVQQIQTSFEPIRYIPARMESLTTSLSMERYSDNTTEVMLSYSPFEPNQSPCHFWDASIKVDIGTRVSTRRFNEIRRVELKAGFAISWTSNGNFVDAILSIQDGYQMVSLLTKAGMLDDSKVKKDDFAIPSEIYIEKLISLSDKMVYSDTQGKQFNQTYIVVACREVSSGEPRLAVRLLQIKMDSENQWIPTITNSTMQTGLPVDRTEISAVWSKDYRPVVLSYSETEDSPSVDVYAEMCIGRPGNILNFKNTNLYSIFQSRGQVFVLHTTHKDQDFSFYSLDQNCNWVQSKISIAFNNGTTISSSLYHAASCTGSFRSNKEYNKIIFGCVFYGQSVLWANFSFTDDIKLMGYAESSPYKQWTANKVRYSSEGFAVVVGEDVKNDNNYQADRRGVAYYHAGSSESFSPYVSGGLLNHTLKWKDFAVITGKDGSSYVKVFEDSILYIFSIKEPKDIIQRIPITKFKRGENLKVEWRGANNVNNTLTVQLETSIDLEKNARSLKWFIYIGITLFILCISLTIWAYARWRREEAERLYNKYSHYSKPQSIKSDLENDFHLSINNSSMNGIRNGLGIIEDQ